MNSPGIMMATNSAQLVVALTLGVLLLWFHRRFDRSFLRSWAWSWLAYTCYLAGATLLLVLSLPGLAPAFWLPPLAATVALTAACVQAGYLVIGARELRSGQSSGQREQGRVLLPLLALGLAASLLFIWQPDPAGLPYVNQAGLRGLVAAAAFGYTARVLWSHPARRRSIGLQLLIGSFALFSLQQAAYLPASALEIAGSLPAADWMGFVDLALQWVMGVAMMITLLEDEREHAVRAAERAEHLAYHDPLTALPNRKLFVDRLDLELALARREPHRRLAVMFLDLDHFKVVNDSLGHAAGDRVLSTVGERIQSAIRGSDTLSRFGGDEFALMFPDTTPEAAAIIAQKILTVLESPVLVEQVEIVPTASLGIALYPDDGLDVSTLMRNADLAMYRAKERGRNRYRFHRSSMNTRAETRLALEAGLRHALERSELLLHYQPIVDARTRRIRRVEALVRWAHPEWGLLPPARFLEVAETSGLVVDIGRWTLETAVNALRRWRDAGASDLGVSVNLSSRHFGEPALVAGIEQVLSSSGLPGHALELEVTEGTAITRPERTAELLKQLKVLGVRIAIDDFGSGYSALTYLKRFPVDTLKVDDSFVQGALDHRLDAAIIAAVARLGRIMGVEVVGEGVETEAQLRHLQECGVDLAQGYLISPPVTESEMTRLLASGPSGLEAAPVPPARVTP